MVLERDAVVRVQSHPKVFTLIAAVQRNANAVLSEEVAIFFASFAQGINGINDQKKTFKAQICAQILPLNPVDHPGHRADTDVSFAFLQGVHRQVLLN